MENFIELPNLSSPKTLLQIASEVKPNGTFEVLSQLPLDKNIVFIDAYGVFYNGSSLIEGIPEQMEELRKQGRMVVVVSNATQLSEESKKSYANRGLHKGKHYDYFVTSGDVFRKAVMDGTLAKKILGTEDKKIKIYVHGKPNSALFAGVDKFEITKNLEKSDAVYMSIPQYTFEEIKAMYSDVVLNNEGNLINLPENVASMFKKSNLTKSGEPDRWDSVSIDQFMPFLEKCIKLGKPILNANPDKSAPEKEKGTNNTNQVVRNGTLTRKYLEMKGEVLEYGKPNQSVYEYTMNLIGLEITEDNKKRSIMIGDTEKTDIAGAENFGIDSVLTIGTGNAGRKLNKTTSKTHNPPLTQEQKLKNSHATYFVRNISI